MKSTDRCSTAPSGPMLTSGCSTGQRSSACTAWSRRSRTRRTCASNAAAFASRRSCTASVCHGTSGRMRCHALSSTIARSIGWRATQAFHAASKRLTSRSADSRYSTYRWHALPPNSNAAWRPST
ncbi:putative lipoprotein [Burkholderia pseudomallei S13]|nr:putative lipoprotein [Burkholderia pseudomallei S13]